MPHPTLASRGVETAAAEMPAARIRDRQDSAWARERNTARMFICFLSCKAAQFGGHAAYITVYAASIKKVLRQKEERVIYFDNAATGGRKPYAVQRAVRAATEGCCANPGRSGHALALAMAEDVLRARQLLARFFNAPDPERVIFTQNCTHALNLAIFGLCPENGETSPKIHVVSTVAEHNSVLRPLFALERRGKISLTLVGLSGGRIRPQDIADAVREDTAAAVFTLASNVTGMTVDPAAVRALLPERVLTVCDGAQACGHIPVDMQGAGIDALAVAGHKGMCGIQGSGALLLSPRYSPPPLLYGGTGSESANPDMPLFYPDRLEAGTISCPAAVSLAEGVIHLTPRLNKNAAHLKELTGVLVRDLRETEGIRVYSRPNACGIVAFACEHLQSEFFAQRLSDEYGIAVRGGLHCAPKMHEALGTAEGLVRASLSEYNTRAETEAFLRAVRAICASVR